MPKVLVSRVETHFPEDAAVSRHELIMAGTNISI